MYNKSHTWDMKGQTIIKHFDSESDLIIDFRIATEPDIIIKTVCGKWYSDEVLQELVKHQCDSFTCYYDGKLEVTVCTYVFPTRMDYVACEMR